MKNNKDEIKTANRRAMPMFILILIISTAIGFTIGWCAVEFGFSRMADGIKSGAAFFGMHIAPWLLVALAVVLPVAAAPQYRNAKNLLADWDGEDETVPNVAEAKLSVILWLSSAAIIVAYFLIAAVYSGGLSIFENDANTLPFFAAIVGFLAVLIEAVVIQQKCVDATKRLNPEKKASVYDMKFQKKWLDSCDEAEKAIIGKCAFKAYRATNTACALFALLLTISGLIFGGGFLPSLAVCVIWLVNQSVYCKEAMKYPGLK